VRNESKDEISQYISQIEITNSKENAVVHLWFPFKTQVGHIALTLSNGIHISFWLGYKGSPGSSSSYQD
jgi:hypothetical protein